MSGARPLSGAALLLAASTLATAGGASVAAQTRTEPVPQARDMPTTAASYPFLATSHDLVPFDLAAVGYREDEVLVSGKGAVFDWGPDGKPMIKTAEAPFATRILVRRPADKARFSGVVVVEPMFDARSSDWAMMWGYLHPKMVRDGDVWVGVTLPKSVQSLKTFDAARYAELSFAPPGPLACKTGEAGDALEEGLRFDMLAQVGALLKSEAHGNPLAGYGPRRQLFMTAQGLDVGTYATLFQTRLRLPGGGRIYDGFLLKSQSGALAKLNHCAQGAPATDPRSALKGIGASVIAVISPGEVLSSLASRREDSDDKADPYRRYEVAAGNHLDANAYTGFADLQDQAKAGVAQGTRQWPFTVRCTPEIQLGHNPLMTYIYDSALQNLAAWAAGGPPPPRAGRITLRTGPSGGQAVALDVNGVALGGVRSVFSDMPTSADSLGSAGPGNCREIGSTVAFGWTYLWSLYGSPQAYAAKALPMVDEMARQRWLVPADAAALRAEIAAPPTPPTMPPG